MNGIGLSGLRALSAAERNALEASLRGACPGGREVVASLLRRLAPRAGPASRALLELWAARAETSDPEIALELARWLHACGYPTFRGYNAYGVADEALARPGPGVAARLAEANPAEPDAEYHRLFAIVQPGAQSFRAAIVDGDHPDASHAWLKGRVGQGAGHAGARDGRWHATMVASTALRGLEDGELASYTSDYGLDEAARAGARLVNASFREERSDAFLRALDAHPALLVIKSAGNTGDRLSRAGTSAASSVRPNLIVVANLGPDGALWSGRRPSNRGAPFVTLAAPGEGRQAALADVNGWMAGSGTSNAAPYVFNVAYKCLRLDPRLEAHQLKQLLTATARRDPRVAPADVLFGVVDGAKAMRVAALTALLRRGVGGREARARVGAGEALLGEAKALAGPPGRRFRSF